MLTPIFTSTPRQFSEGPTPPPPALVKRVSNYDNFFPHRDLKINQLYFEIFNSTQKQSLTTDTRHVNDLGPAKFRTQTDNDTEQICYNNRNKRH